MRGAIKPDREKEIRTATEALVQALLRAVEDAQPAQDVPDRLLSVGEAAELLGIGRSKLYDEVAARRIRSFRIGRRRLIPSGAIEEFMAARTVAE